MATRSDDSRGRILAASLDINRDWVGVEAARNQEDLHLATAHKKSRQEHIDLVQPGVLALYPREESRCESALLPPPVSGSSSTGIKRAFQYHSSIGKCSTPRRVCHSCRETPVILCWLILAGAGWPPVKL